MSDIMNRYADVYKERDGLLCALASERDAWGKLETEYLVKIKRMTTALKFIELHGENCGHDGMGPDIPCPCGACMAEEATKGLATEAARKDKS